MLIYAKLVHARSASVIRWASCESELCFLGLFESQFQHVSENAAIQTAWPGQAKRRQQLKLVARASDFSGRIMWSPLALTNLQVDLI